MAQLESDANRGDGAFDAEKPRNMSSSRGESDVTHIDTMIEAPQDEPAWPHLTRRNTDLIDESDRQELERIATVLSNRMSNIREADVQDLDGLTTIESGDPSLDPKSKEFDMAKWLNVSLQKLEAGGYKHQQTGVLFKELSISGSGEAVQLQKTVGDMLTAPLRAAELFRRGKGSSKTILNKFNGLVKSGELLVVLGRPGSGCSTLLKSLCGELHGLQVHEESSITYKGVPQKQMLREFKGEMQYNQEVRLLLPS